MNIEELCADNTRNFLQSYRIRKAMSQVSGYDENESQETSADIDSAPIRPFDPDLKCGQIRLLADLETLTYVLLLKRWDDDSFLVTAFSHYDFPATDEEMSLERYAGAFLNVLQIWNTRTLRDETLRRSWCCGMLPEKMRLDAWDFWQAQLTGKLPDRLRARSGVPVDSPTDERLTYMHEEMTVFAEIDAADLQPEQNASRRTLPAWFDDSLILPPLWQQSTALAAGGEQKNIRKRCSISNRPEVLFLEYSPQEKKVWIRIFSEAGERVRSLDGSAIVDARERSLGVIANGGGEFPVPEGFDGSFALRLPDGRIGILAEKK